MSATIEVSSRMNGSSFLPFCAGSLDGLSIGVAPISDYDNRWASSCRIVEGAAME